MSQSFCSQPPEVPIFSLLCQLWFNSRWKGRWESSLVEGGCALLKSWRTEVWPLPMFSSTPALVPAGSWGRAAFALVFQKFVPQIPGARQAASQHPSAELWPQLVQLRKGIRSKTTLQAAQDNSLACLFSPFPSPVVNRVMLEHKTCYNPGWSEECLKTVLNSVPSPRFQWEHSYSQNYVPV